MRIPDEATLDITLVTVAEAPLAAAIMTISDGGPSLVIFSAKRVDRPVVQINLSVTTHSGVTQTLLI